MKDIMNEEFLELTESLDLSDLEKKNLFKKYKKEGYDSFVEELIKVADAKIETEEKELKRIEEELKLANERLKKEKHQRQEAFEQEFGKLYRENFNLDQEIKENSELEANLLKIDAQVDKKADDLNRYFKERRKAI